MAIIQYQAKIEPVLTAAQEAETVTESRWHQPWSEPVRFRIAAGLAVALAAASGNSFCPLPIPNVNPTADRYGFEFSQPVRVKLGLAPSEQQFLAFVEAPPFNETVVESKWHQPWSEPVRVPPSLRTADQQFFAQPFPPYPESVTEDRWHQAWSEPVRIKPGLLPGLNPYTSMEVPFQPVQLVDRWFVPWTDPVRLPIGLRAELQRPLALTEAIFRETVTESRWHQAWSEPVRVKPGLGAAWQLGPVNLVLVPLTPRLTLANSLVRVRYLGPKIPNPQGI